MTISIGDWVCRSDRDRIHYVDSLVAEDVMTKCGKRMALDLNGHPLIGYSPGMLPLGVVEYYTCRTCQRIKERGE